jgi:hypothetical protein
MEFDVLVEVIPVWYQNIETIVVPTFILHSRELVSAKWKFKMAMVSI